MLAEFLMTNGSLAFSLRDMDVDFLADWNRLGELAFKRQKRTGDVFKTVCQLLKSSKYQRDHQWLGIIKNWLLVPFTLWPIDFAGLATHACKEIRRGRRLDKRTVFVLEQMETLPTEKARTAIAEYERFVERGMYEPLLHPDSKCKYDVEEREVLSNRRLRKEWQELKRLFDADKFRDSKGILRRRMAQERNFRPDWDFKWRRKKERFRVVFDAFCHRWNLYGMEKDKPLLLKLSVNPTAHGLMIFIPSYWSFDRKRDLQWKEIIKLHKARGPLRQGPKMSEGRLERHRQACLAYEASSKARARGLRGEARMDFIRKNASLPLHSDSRTIRRFIREGSKL